MSLLWLWLGLTSVGASTDLQIRPVADPLHVEVSAKLSDGLKRKIPSGKLSFDKGREYLWLSLMPSSGEVGPPMLGRYERKGDRLLFRPRFGLTAKERYRAHYRKNADTTLTLDYRAPDPKNAKSPKVVRVYPTASVLPANHLRFVIHFSQPMRGGKEIFDQIVIIDDKGKEVVGPWLCNELWSSDGTMLVLYIHPGRIKWGVLLRKTLGPVLVPNRQYRFVIRSTMLAANGKRLQKEYSKSFRAVVENRKRISLANAKITAPITGTMNPVTLRFENIIDHNSLQQLIHVEDQKGRKISGKISVGDEERIWRFVPNQEWLDGQYTIVIDPRLEDHAGNTPVRPFDLDLSAPKLAPQNLRINFTPSQAE